MIIHKLWIIINTYICELKVLPRQLGHVDMHSWWSKILPRKCEHHVHNAVMLKGTIFSKFTMFTIFTMLTMQSCSNVHQLCTYCHSLSKCLAFSLPYWALHFTYCSHLSHFFALGHLSYFQPFTYAVCLNELGNEIVHQYVGQVKIFLLKSLNDNALAM